MSAPVFKEKCYPELVELYEELKAHRQDIHAHPELGFNTERTVRRLVDFLQRHGISKIDTSTVKGCVFALIEGKDKGATIALRADIDALPMDDKTDNAWKSTHPGKAHTCGHDGHQTWILGAAAYLAAHNDFKGRVLCIFQAAEELGLGAKAVVEAGILKQYDVKEIYAAHDEPFLDKGCFGFKIGHLQAAADIVQVTLKGVGTHGGRPHKGVDPIPAITELYTAYQTIVSRKIDPLESAVVSICSIYAGNPASYNIVPGEAGLCGTIRTFKPSIRDFIETNLQRLAEGIATAHGLECQFKYTRQISSLNNDKVCTEAGIEQAIALVGEANVVKDMTPFMSSEDFSAYQEQIPGSVLRVGIRDKNHTIPIHNPYFDFNDEVLPLTSTLFVKIVKSRLEALTK